MGQPVFFVMIAYHILSLMMQGSTNGNLPLLCGIELRYSDYENINCVCILYTPLI